MARATRGGRTIPEGESTPLVKSLAQLVPSLGWGFPFSGQLPAVAVFRVRADLLTPVLRWKDRQMPYLQLDTPFSYSTETEQRLAKRLGEIYAEKMNSNVNRISVAIRQLGEGGVWRCGEGDPRPAALLMCDIRRGRPAQQRAELARMLIDACIEENLQACASLRIVKHMLEGW